ncbi:hypothetical protein PIB30_091867 [Stylosanthes scabra]|uniref:Uncharacterized protein n=1 Tax=Stylosanthes scabra TaxID=79078 RepID=A0ABU6WXJ0_9FABA|nr:hypothetical protein [Stylosanthes scabra]
MLLDTTHINPMDMVMHIMIMKILHHHTIPTFSNWHGRSSSVVMSGKERALESPKTNRRSSDHLTTEWEESLSCFYVLHEEDVESLIHEEVHEYLEEVEEENKDQEVEVVDQEVEDEDKESKWMEIVHSSSFEATTPESPSKLYFKWVNLSDLNFIGPQHTDLLETDGQLRALCGV